MNDLCRGMIGFTGNGDKMKYECCLYVFGIENHVFYTNTIIRICIGAKRMIVIWFIWYF